MTIVFLFVGPGPINVLDFQNSFLKQFKKKLQLHLLSPEMFCSLCFLCSEMVVFPLAGVEDAP